MSAAVAMTLCENGGKVKGKKVCLQSGEERSDSSDTHCVRRSTNRLAANRKAFTRWFSSSVASQ